MTKVLLKLGEFTFSIDTAAFQNLKRNWQFNWASQQRLGNKPAQQFTGEGNQTIALSGSIYPGQFGKADSVAKMVEAAEKGIPYLLVAGTGEVMGYWAIAGASQANSVLMADGQPRRIDFSLSLIFYGDEYAV